jgi:hypothetical protein
MCSADESAAHLQQSLITEPQLQGPQGMDQATGRQWQVLTAYASGV